MSLFKHALIIGASSGVGRALALALGKSGCTVTLAARDLRDLEAVARHINLSSGAPATSLCLDLEEPSRLNFSEYDAVFVTAGLSLAEDDAQLLPQNTDVPALVRKILGVNLVGPAQMLLPVFCEFKRRSSPTYIGICSSIAAPVPRSRNLIYAAAKNGLESLLLSLQHAASGTKVSVQIFRLGYVDSSLSYGQKLLFPALSPEFIAQAMLQCAQKPALRLIYLPGYWRYIVIALKLLPWALFSKMKF
ncbi:MAG: SDR family NAD(P)-dependent oxidoreductase [Proteobacteria bacterium]|nr:SDR family NAD(P)-dependent oxidoreductase [Pseudomonadota bacterium]